MKIIICFLVLFSVISCDSNNDVEQELSSPLPSSMKGYELYSWQVDAKWSYTLITGTNRNKTYAEITAEDNIETNEWVKITVQNTDDLKKLLERIPELEYVTWISNDVRVSGFSLPSSSIVKEIEALSKTLKLNFEVN